MTPDQKIHELLQAGLAKHQVGDYVAAAKIYQSVLRIANSPDAHHLLGVVKSQLGDHSGGINSIGQAIAIAPDRSIYHSNLTEILLLTNDAAQAAASQERATALLPTDSQGWTKLAAIYEKLNQFERAELSLRKAVDLQKHSVESTLLLVNFYKRHRGFAKAETELAIACCVHPASSLLLKLRGDCQRELGRIEEALASYKRALSSELTNVGACIGVGICLQGLGRDDEAIECYRRANELHPTPQAFNNLGVCLSNRSFLKEAIQAYQAAIRLKEGYFKAYNNLGVALQDIGGHDEEAIQAFRQASLHFPDYFAAKANLVYLLLHTCSWESVVPLCEDLKRHLESANTLSKFADTDFVSPFTYLAFPTVTSVAQQRKCSEIWSHFKVKSTDARYEPRLGHRDSIRVGYLSSDFHEHPTARLIVDLLQKHDRTKFEVFGYSYGDDDSSNIRRRLINACDTFRDIRTQSFSQSADTIYADGIDILIDLKGFTKNCRTEIMAMRPAPLQVSYLGYPGTMGSSCVDYLVADEYLIPPQFRHGYSESIVFIPGCYQVNSEFATSTLLPEERSSYGLPEDAFVYCSFNSNYKITQAMFDTWMRVLSRVENSVLWILQTSSLARNNMLHRAEQLGVAAKRLVFCGNADHLNHIARQKVADLFLDTFPVNAHTGASDALRVGLPLLTLSGDTFASRVAGSLLSNLGLTDLITFSLEQYEEYAVELGNSKSASEHLHNRLSEALRKTDVFDSAAFAFKLERSFSKMWDLRSNGQPNADIAFEL